MPTHDFSIASDAGSARRLITDAFVSHGYSVSDSPSGGLFARRGSTGLSVAFGAMAGRNFKVAFTVDFAIDPQGRPVAQITREAGSWVGGAIGVEMADTAERQILNEVNARLQHHGLFAGYLKR